MTHTEIQVAAKPSQRWLWLLGAFTCLAVVIGWLLTAEDTIDIQQTETAPPKSPVSIEMVTVQPATVKVSAFSEVRPRWSAELKATVSGRVISVADKALAGSHVKQGTTLIQLEDTPYIAEVARTELDLADAKRQLLRAESETAVARRQYRNRGNQPANNMALRLPELNVAQKAVASAEARLAAANLQRNNATVKAPFSGFVTERLVSMGQSVNAGDPLLRLVDDRTLELTVELSRDDWALVEKPVSGRYAQLFDTHDKPLGQALVRQGGGFLDQKSRQYRIFLEIADADNSPVLSGDFVRVALPGITVDSALDIPESALTRSGEVWYVDDQNQLQKLLPEIMFRHQQRLVIRAPMGAQHWRIATTPLAAFLPGQQVNPQGS